ncbi:hotdog fold thioesterase [Rubrobacter marinus]|uniref:Hotdog fold thioesterase n=2 Tax=Rubrobacter marinus TaxID=2653852 RepID=A0A6G8Q2A2_9ACTN|nr:hotdog fold thioesterase [Rubrobacter marinus]
MSGLEFLRSMGRGELPGPPIAELMGFGVAEVEEGRVVFECVPAEYHYNPIGTVHGGLACALFDSAMGCAVHSELPAGVGYTTVELKVNFLRPIGIRTGRVLCEGKTIHVGGRIATAEARLLDEGGRLYGHATTTCMIFRGENGGNDRKDAGPVGEGEGAS